MELCSKPQHNIWSKREVEAGLSRIQGVPRGCILGFRTNCEPVEGHSLVRLPFSDSGIPSRAARHQSAMPHPTAHLLAPPCVDNAV